MAQTKLSEAQSELNRQELGMQCADRALHESGIQLYSQRMELYQGTQSNDLSPREKQIGYAPSWKGETELFKKIVRKVFKKEEMKNVLYRS